MGVTYIMSKHLVALIVLCLTSAPASLAGGEAECFENDTDYKETTDLTDGQTYKADSALDCWKKCLKKPKCDGFSWATADFTYNNDKSFAMGCWLKKGIKGKS